jgi:hypothetical protein
MEEPYQGKLDLWKDRLACLCQRNGIDQERDRDWDIDQERNPKGFLNWRGWLTFCSISSSPMSEIYSLVAISASGSGQSRNYSTSSKGVKE